MHLLFISIHAVFATVALLVGLLGLRHPRLLPIHTWATTGMSAALPLSLFAGWSDLTAVTRPTFVALFVLSIVMVLQAFRAERAWRTVAPWYVVLDRVGFNIIGYTTGFLAVAVLRVGAAPAVIILVAAGIPVAGHLCLRWLRTRPAPRTWPVAAGNVVAGDSMERG